MWSWVWGNWGWWRCGIHLVDILYTIRPFIQWLCWSRSTKRCGLIPARRGWPQVEGYPVTDKSAYVCWLEMAIVAHLAAGQTCTKLSRQNCPFNVKPSGTNRTSSSSSRRRLVKNFDEVALSHMNFSIFPEIGFGRTDVSVSEIRMWYANQQLFMSLLAS